MASRSAVQQVEKSETNRRFPRPRIPAPASTIHTMSDGHDVGSPEAKRKAWAAVQQTDPELAAFIKEVAEVFGAPQGITIEVGGEVMFDNMPPMPPKRSLPPKPRKIKNPPPRKKRWEW